MRDFSWFFFPISVCTASSWPNRCSRVWTIQATVYAGLWSWKNCTSRHAWRATIAGASSQKLVSCLLWTELCWELNSIKDYFILTHTRSKLCSFPLVLEMRKCFPVDFVCLCRCVKPEKSIYRSSCTYNASFRPLLIILFGFVGEMLELKVAFLLWDWNLICLYNVYRWGLPTVTLLALLHSIT